MKRESSAAQDEARTSSNPAAVKDEFADEQQQILQQMTRRQLECKTLGRLRGKKRDPTERVTIKQKLQSPRGRGAGRKPSKKRQMLDDQLGAWAAQMDSGAALNE